MGNKTKFDVSSLISSVTDDIVDKQEEIKQARTNRNTPSNSDKSVPTQTASPEVISNIKEEETEQFQPTGTPKAEKERGEHPKTEKPPKIEKKEAIQEEETSKDIANTFYIDIDTATKLTKLKRIQKRPVKLIVYDAVIEYLKKFDL